MWREFLGRGLQLLITLMSRQFGMAVLVTDKNSNDLVVVKNRIEKGAPNSRRQVADYNGGE